MHKWSIRLRACLSITCTMVWLSISASGRDGEGVQQQQQAVAETAEAVRKRITDKVERVKLGEQKWVSNGRDPSAFSSQWNRR